MSAKANFPTGLLSLVLLLGVAPVTPAGSASTKPKTESRKSFAKEVQPLLSRYCYSCHGEKQKGDLDLRVFKDEQSASKNQRVFEKVLKNLQAHEMPPENKPQPTPAERELIATWVTQFFFPCDCDHPDPGRITIRRLNRAEYNNTIRDLVGVDFEPGADFPTDDSGYGFDNIGDVLSLSPVLMEKYLTAAERVAREALFGPDQMKPAMVKLRPALQRIIPSLAPLSDYDATGLTLPNALHVVHRFPADGEYIVRAFLNGSRPLGSEPLSIALWVDGQQVQSIELDPTKTASFDDQERQDLGGKVQEFRIKVTAGEHWLAASILRIYEGLPARYHGPNPSRIPPRPLPQFRPRTNVPPAQLEEFKKRFEERIANIEKAPANEARLTSFEIGGPYNQANGPSPESRRKIYACGHLVGHHNRACASKIVADLAGRAFRRPVTSQEIDNLLRFVSMAEKNGDSFEEGLCQSLQAILVSPHFLFRVEQNRASNVNDHELAARLSYFLWSSMPDAELTRLANQQKLHSPGVLETQVRRMLELETRFDVHALLKEHRVPLRYTESDLADDLAALRAIGVLPGP